MVVVVVVVVVLCGVRYISCQVAFVMGEFPTVLSEPLLYGEYSYSFMCCALFSGTLPTGSSTAACLPACPPARLPACLPRAAWCLSLAANRSLDDDDE